mmetsp:Transcript_25764/g.36663  ORF Transcript_25764/g.36663 Transcript_25764/m.36663 type:complete len:356 (-) Transcript_25764:33-1100(-)
MSQSIRMLERRYRQSLRRKVPYRHFFTAAPSVWSGSIPQAMKNNLNQEVKTVPIIPHFSTPFPAVGHARNFAIMEQHDDAPTDEAVLGPKNVTLPKIDGIEDIDPSMQSIIQQLQRQFSQQLESQRQFSLSLHQKLNLQRQDFQREISGIRQGLLPSTLYAFLEYTTKVYVSDNTDKPMTEKFHSEKEQKICCLLVRASIAALLGNNSNKNWPSNRTVAALGMSRNEVICTSLQVAIHFCFAIGVYMKDWPPERNIVSHNGGFLKAFFPKIELRDCFSGPKPISSELPPLSEGMAMEIATIINDRRWKQVKNVKEGLDKLAETLSTNCRLRVAEEQDREQLAGLIREHYKKQESG